MKKTSKTIEKSLTDPTREAIAAHLRTAPKSHWLFPGEFADKPLSRQTLHRIFKRHLKALLGDGISLRGSSTHSLRRSVSSIISEKHGIESASVFLGHSSLQNTIVYLNKHKLQQRADQVIRDMDL
jgi:integrase